MTAIIEPIPDVYRVEQFVDAARQRAGVPDFEFAHLDALDRLLTALDEEGQLNAAGRASVRGALVAALATQAAAERAREKNPQIEKTEIHRPVFITGMTRSGTTLMHNLLGQHPDLRSPDLWELMAPATDGRDEATKQALVRAAENFCTDYYTVAPRLKAVHLWEPHRPDEDHRLTAPTFKTMAYELRYTVPSYGEWLKTQDQYDAYDYHRYLMQHIVWRVPTETLVLKDPFHLWRADALVRTYPDARLIYMHRAPSVTIPSTCSLTEIIRLARSDHADRLALGRLWTQRFAEMLELFATAQREHLGGTPVLDVDYQRLMASPIEVMAEICEFLGASWNGTVERAFRDYLADNRKDKLGRHEYRAQDYGLDPDELDERFAGYLTRYRIGGRA
ncbi:sulfotransferase family protein [Actinoplanes teichomyceticus]|uniref:Sulfotransferase family protein n=1 Tax=Actinoplanes teichomyceticus TaxID=1867 RepID=A0A561WBL1_ACTTI|nr:sulfotransferase [Actinoplanes teichomyceticus]TWG21257.1 sulfotransferase family protein [Actinoplanes teichomyceticus]GIF16730.1 sulfotransferase [Actinoplanes teichomyceticus]